ncbi:MAG: aa3-type cytochrome c oxidase subunit IV [Roseovarius sp.]|nr:aa3-type cytochrome c oxidase subunit IV [Roseovarius sp.]
MSDHKHGEMDIKAHERTFDGFIRALAWSGGISIVVLIFIALVNS